MIDCPRHGAGWVYLDRQDQDYHCIVCGWVERDEEAIAAALAEGHPRENTRMKRKPGLSATARPWGRKVAPAIAPDEMEKFVARAWEYRR